MAESTASRRRNRMRRVLQYIDDHLEDDLSLDLLSDVAALSSFHIHRRFTGFVGTTPHRYVQLARLKRASYRLAFRHAPITDIAFESGYGSPEAFSRAFRHRFGQAPSAFRRQPDWVRWGKSFGPIVPAWDGGRERTSGDARVRIVEVAEIPLAVLSHDNAAIPLQRSLQRFVAWRRRAGVRPPGSATFNILFADGRIDLGAATARHVQPNPYGVVAGRVPAGCYAVLRHVGTDVGLRATASFLASDWAPRSGQVENSHPLYVQRLSLFPDVPESHTVADVFLRLR